MKTKLLSGAVAVFAIAGVTWAIWPKGPDVATACAATSARIGAGAPAELAAMLDRDCAAAWVAEAGPAAAFDLGYPSFAFEHAAKDEVMEVIAATINEGDRGFFAADPALLDQLDAGPLADTVRASLTPQAALAQADDVATVLQSVPIWNASGNAAVIVAGCNGVDCNSDESSCAGYVGMSDKLAVALGTKPLADVYAACPVSPGWVLGLRRAGLVDTACTSSLAVNRAMADPSALGTACFGDDFDASAIPAVSSADFPRLIRALGVTGLADIAPGTVAAMQSAYPEAAGYLNSIGDQ